MVSEEPIPEKGRVVAYSDSPIEETKHRAEHAARHASPWVDRMARAGYAAKGVVYATIGVLAMREALGLGGTTTGVGGAMRSMGPQPLAEYCSSFLPLDSSGTRCGSWYRGSWTPTRKGPTLTASCAASAMSGAALS